MADRADTSRDGRVSPIDALRVINELLANGSHATPMEIDNATMFLDTSLNGRISPQDLLIVINYLLANPPSSQSAAPAAAPAAVPAATPAAVAAPVEADDSQASVATALVMSGAGSTASAASTIAPLAADAAYTDLATASSQVATPAADAAWTEFDPIDELLDDEASEFGLDIDWKSVEE